MSKYESGTKYTWSATEKFEISGKDLELLKNGLEVVEEMVNQNTTNISLEKFLLLVESYKAIQSRFISYVEKDLIKASENS